jgi:dTDP-4-dehydrorhamnose 3,5-epimerase
MIFHGTGLGGAFLIEPEPSCDERGLFARTWSQEEFANRGLIPHFDYCAASFNREAGTLRGLHYQTEPEIKLVRCTRGRIFDVIVDLRPASPTYRRWFAAELDADNRRMIYAPAGFAHGFQTLEPASEVFYQIAANFRPELQRGIRWDDPTLAIAWPPAARRILSARDHALPTLASAMRGACEEVRCIP